MKFEWGDYDEVAANSQAFLARNCVDISKAVNLFISGSTTWEVVRRVDFSNAGEGMTVPDDRVAADALITDVKGLALFLPTADCYPTTLYDIENGAIGLLHLGWQSSAAHLVTKAVAAMKKEFGTDPTRLSVYFGPGIKRQSYRFENPAQLADREWRPFLQEFDDGMWGIDLVGFNTHLLENEGVPRQAISASTVDTATDPAYFSNYGSNRLGKPGPEGRFATIAMMCP